jgi:hypothetical protein
MQKAIYLENTSNSIKRVLSIADISAAEISPDGLSYIDIDNYIEPPQLDNPLDVNYPLYNTETSEFYWVTVKYQNTATESLFQTELLKNELEKVKAENLSLQEVVDALLLESLGGVE